MATIPLEGWLAVAIALALTTALVALFLRSPKPISRIDVGNLSQGWIVEHRGDRTYDNV